MTIKMLRFLLVASLAKFVSSEIFQSIILPLNMHMYTIWFEKKTIWFEKYYWMMQLNIGSVRICWFASFISTNEPLNRSRLVNNLLCYANLSRLVSYLLRVQMKLIANWLLTYFNKVRQIGSTAIWRSCQNASQCEVDILRQR